MRDRTRFAPAMMLGVGCLLLVGVQAQRSLDLQQPLTNLPDPVPGYEHVDLEVPKDQARIAGMTSYVNRVFTENDKEVYGLYVGFYDSQEQGRTVHSPKNCLPGGGWEAMDAGRVDIAVPGREAPESVNRYIIANKAQKAIVYYWYQGRGRVAANEYVVKWNLLRDAAVRRRTDEALVRLVIPVTETMTIEQADVLAARAAVMLIPTLDGYLPA